MTASGGLYPSLGRYFGTMTELAHAGCMSRTRAYECLHGIKTFTRAEKKAISANIAAKLMTRNQIEYNDLTDALKAYQGEFDEVYKIKGEMNQC